MDFAFEPNASIEKELRRVASERLADAAETIKRLDRSGPSRADPLSEADVESSIHEIRKRCKEVRALARLVRGQLDEEFRSFNGFVRDAADELGTLRDAHAVLRTFDDLRAVRGSNDDRLDSVRERQAKLAERATFDVGAGDDRVRRAREQLSAARRRIRAWDIPDDPAVLFRALETTYRHGERGLRRARKRPTDERLHEWRKAVKTLWYQLRLLEQAAPSVIAPLISAVDDLAEALGDDHDLAVLVARLEADPGAFGGKKAVKRAVRLAREQQDDLRRRAFRVGLSVYAETPAAFASRVGAYWEATRLHGPELATGRIADLGAGDESTQDPRPPAVAAPSAKSLERERKWLVTELPDLVEPGTALRQGYLAIDGKVSLRVRDAGDGAYTMTVKAGSGAVRSELEWQLTEAQFDATWSQTAGRRLRKTRYRVPLDGDDSQEASGSAVAEVDVFLDELAGLVIVEVEFGSDDALARFRPPSWFGTEVTDNAQFANASLAVVGRPAAGTHGRS